MYYLAFDDKAIVFLQKLPKKTAKRIFDKLLSAKPDPYRFFERLQGRNDYKLRMGDYRVVADIDASNRTIRVN